MNLSMKLNNDMIAIVRHCAAAFCLAVSVICTVPAVEAGPLYASNGLGVLVSDTYGRARAMGGAGIADIDGYNLIRGNPALLSTFSRHTYSFGATLDRNTAYWGGKENPTFTKTQADVFRIVMPLGKGIVAGWGLSPLSRTDSVIEYSGSGYRDVIEFSGGLNMSSLGIAGTFGGIVRAGVSFDYVFGMKQERWVRSIDIEDMHNSEDIIKVKNKGYGVTFGMIVRVRNNVHVGLGYSPDINLDTTKRAVPGEYSNPEVILATSSSALPERWRFGVSTVFRDLVTANIDMSLEGWENVAGTPTEKEMFANTHMIGAGIRLHADDSYGASFYRRMPISAGFKAGTLYYKSFPKVDVVDEKALTLGVEIPLKENAASLLTSFEYGVRGDKSKNGWEENYMSIGILLIGTIK